MDEKPWVVKPRGKPHYVVRWRDPATGRVRQRSTGTPRRREAERIADQLGEELHAGVRPDVIAWSEFCARYEREGMSGCRPKTVAKWRTAKRHAARVLNPATVRDLSADALSRLRSELADGERSPETVDGHLRHLLVALRWAESVGLVKRAPRLPRRKRGGARSGMKGRPITTEEFERLLKKTAAVVGREHAASWKRLWWCGWLSGLRLNELLRLSWDDPACLRVLDVDDAQPLLLVPAELDKGGLERMQPITPDFAEWLRATPPAERSGYVLAPTGPRGVTRSLEWVSDRLSDIGKRALVVVDAKREAKTKYASAHDLRRTFGERWAARVMPAVLQQLMRHADIKTTMKYYVGQESRRLAASVWQWKPASADADQRDPQRDPEASGREHEPEEAL